MRRRTLLPPPLSTALLCAALAGPFCRAAAGQEKTFTLPKTERQYKLLLPAGIRPRTQTGQADKTGETKKAAQSKKAPLVVYLHPTGTARLKDLKRDYWPLLAKRGCAVAIPLSESKEMWTAGSDAYTNQVIADVQRRYHVDPKRVVLLGISGGGQLALFLADKWPEAFRAVIVVSTNPVVVRDDSAVWFYPNRKVLKSCPYFVACHITHGASLRYWRQVRARLAAAGASISIVPVLGKPAHYLPPPKELGPWLDAVLAGKHPAPLPDPQKAAVAKLLAKPAAELFAAIKTARSARPAKAAATLTKTGKALTLSVPLQEGFERSKAEEAIDSAAAPITQIRTEHKKWPIYIRVDGRVTKRAMPAVLAAEEKQTRLRGMLYQIYHSGEVTAGGRTWKVRIGSITFPDRRQNRGWRTTLFIHAAAATGPVAGDKKAAARHEWIEITIMDETQQPDAKELAVVFQTVAGGTSAGPNKP